MEYIFHLTTFLLLFISLAYALDLVLGQTGILPLCLAAFWGVGGYTAAVLSLNQVHSYGIELIVAATLSVGVSLVVSIPSLRLHDDYFVLATFVFQILFTNIMANWASVTNGPLGIAGIRAPIVHGHTISSTSAFLVLTSILTGVAVLATSRIVRSPFGRVLRAIRSDEVFAQSLGKNTVKFKILAFAVTAVLASMVGVTYAHFITYIDPISFNLGQSILVMSMVIIGGAGSRYGPAVGAALLILIPEGIRFLPIPKSTGPIIKDILFSAILLAILVLRPRGLVGARPFGRMRPQ